MTDASILHAALRSDFAAFLEKVFRTLHPDTPFYSNWHLEGMGHALQCHGGDQGGRLIINVPPRSLKSITVSVAYVAWDLGHNPERQYLCVSYSHDLAVTLSSQFRQVVEAAWYRETFPAMHIRRATEQEVKTTKGGGRLATSIGGTLRGRGADVIVIDDPQKEAKDTADSERKTVIDWFTNTALTRLNNKNTGSIIVVMQRLHEADLSGYLLEQGGWHHLNLPAIAEEDQDIPLGPKETYRFRKGDLLHPARLSREALDRAKSEMGSRFFSAQYQQQPVPAEGNIIKRDWLAQRYTEPPAPGDGVQVIQSWDLASSIGEDRAYSVCLTFHVQRKDYYLVDVWRDRLEYPDLKRKVGQLAKAHDATTILIEKAGPGQSLIQELLHEDAMGIPRPIPIQPEGDKAGRMEAQAAKIEEGRLVLPYEATWLATFEHELLAFPNSRYKDQSDALSQFLKWTEKHHVAVMETEEDITSGPCVIEGHSHPGL